MKPFVVMLFLISLLACVFINVGAFIAEKVQKKKVEKMAKDINGE